MSPAPRMYKRSPQYVTAEWFTVEGDGHVEAEV